MRKVWRKHPWLVSGLALASLLALVLAVSLAFDMRDMMGPDREPVQAWMTVGYVAHSWNLHGPDIDRLAGTPLPEGHPLTLAEIAAREGVPASEVVQRVEDAVRQLVAERRAQHRD